MQECRVADAQLRADDRVLLVSGAADRVEAAVRLLQLARRDVDRAAQHLVLPQADRVPRRQAAARAQRRRRLDRCAGLGAREVGVERRLDDGNTIERHAGSARSSSGWWASES